MNCLLCNRTQNYQLTLKQILWPRKVKPAIICQECQNSFVPCETEHACQNCGNAISDGNICQECLQWKQEYGWLLKHHALYRYNSAMKAFMHRYKFMGDYRLRKAFQAKFINAIQSLQPAVVVPIPITEQTWSIRGFNQVIGLMGSVEYQELLATQSKVKQAQSSKNRYERLKTPQPFRIVKFPDQNDAKILLVDDIYTTGRTLYHAAVLFKQAGYYNIESLSLAR